MKNLKTLVVDKTYIARAIISPERAFTIYYKGNADIVHKYKEKFKTVNPDLEIHKPSIIRIYSFVNTNNLIFKVPLSRENIYKRDNYQCVYCQESDKKQLTLDHVIPKSKGGKDTWDNLVTACKRCNNEKSDLTLEEYGKDIPKPYRPHYLMLIKRVQKIPKEWEPYLFL